jgi:uncharacterized SAM-binding protein YcdF (DUF218 family)
MIDLAKTLFAPGTVPFAILVAAAGVLLSVRRGRSRRFGVSICAALAGAYFVLALPASAERLSAGLMKFDRLHDVHDAGGASTIVMIGGDSAHARVVETLRLFHLLRPRWIVDSSPPDMRQALIAGGVPPERIIAEVTARTTREQAVAVAELVRARNLGPVVLVASAIHMPRALGAFRAAGLSVVPSPSATRQIAGLPRYWPAYDGLRLSREAIYEHVAIVYYRWKGWMTDDGY